MNSATTLIDVVWGAAICPATKGGDVVQACALTPCGADAVDPSPWQRLRSILVGSEAFVVMVASGQAS